MKILQSGIEFDSIKTFSSFIFNNDLFGIIQLEEPILDNSGKVLVKEKVMIKENTVKKLESMEGQYKSIFKVLINTELTRKLNEKICKDIFPISESESEENYLLQKLLNSSEAHTGNYKNVVNNAFQNKYMVLSLYKLQIERKTFFEYAAESALLALGIAMTIKRPLRMLNRYSFIGGFLMDMILSETDYWHKPIGGEAQMVQLASLSADISANWLLPHFISDALRANYIPGMYYEGTEEIDFSILAKNPFLEPISNSSSGNEPTKSSPEEDDPEYQQEILATLTEVYKITKFIRETSKKIPENKDLIETLLVNFAYHIEKGTFDKDIADPLIYTFKKYEKIIKKMRRIAMVEKLCIHQPSAWAYPKPFATQILCKNKIDTCPHYVRGWDINVVSAQESMGYIGTPLIPGSYPKCKLEKELDSI